VRARLAATLLAISVIGAAPSGARADDEEDEVCQRCTDCIRRAEVGASVVLAGETIRPALEIGYTWTLEGVFDLGLAGAYVIEGETTSRGARVEIGGWWWAGVPIGFRWRPAPAVVLGLRTLLAFGQVGATQADTESSTGVLVVEPAASISFHPWAPATWSPGLVLRVGYRLVLGSDVDGVGQRALGGLALQAALAFEH
jgi:hypothetical protein